MEGNANQSHIPEFMAYYFKKNNMPKYADAEIHNLICKAHYGDIDARNILVEMQIPYIYNKACSLSTTSSDIEDLFQCGILGCMKAIRRFTFGNRFTYADFVKMGINQDMEIYSRTMSRYRNIISLNDPINDDDLCLLDLIEDDRLDHYPEYYIEEILMRESIMREIEKLSERNRNIIELYFGLNNKPRLSQIQISQIYNISQSYASALIRSSIRCIRKTLAIYD